MGIKIQFWRLEIDESLWRNKEQECNLIRLSLVVIEWWNEVNLNTDTGKYAVHASLAYERNRLGIHEKIDW